MQSLSAKPRKNQLETPATEKVNRALARLLADIEAYPDASRQAAEEEDPERFDGLS